MNAELIKYLEKQKSERVATLAKRSELEAHKKSLLDELENVETELAAVGDVSNINAECAKLDGWIDELKRASKQEDNAVAERTDDTVLIATCNAPAAASANKIN